MRLLTSSQLPELQEEFHNLREEDAAFDELDKRMGISRSPLGVVQYYTPGYITEDFHLAINQDMAYPASFNVTGDHTYCRNLAGRAIALAGLHQTSLGPPTFFTLSPRTTAVASQLADCILPEHAGVTRWHFRDAIKRVDAGVGTLFDCEAGQPGVCLVVATPA